MSSLSDFANGFLVMTVIIWILNIITFFVLGKTLAALIFLLILIIPISIVAYEGWNWKTGKKNVNRLHRLRQILISTYGVSFACWVFDIGSTYYAIDVLGVAAEQNPLGWPFGALGALIFYVPAMVFTYLLLFKVKQTYAILVAIVITVLTLYLGFLNFVAGGQNFGFFIDSVPSFSEAYSYLFSAVIVIDIIYALVFVKLTKLTLPKWMKTRPNLSVIAVILSTIALTISLTQPMYNLIINNSEQQGKSSFELADFYVSYTYTLIEIRNNGTATAKNVIVTFYFLKPPSSNSSYRPFEWTTTEFIEEIKEGESALMAVPVGSYHLESTYQNINATDYSAKVIVHCEQAENLNTIFYLEHLEILPTP
ncbi:MAG: hypothetical protein QXJ94_03375 [Candidatus Bathyarchaeia archaeon]